MQEQRYFLLQELPQSNPVIRQNLSVLKPAIGMFEDQIRSSKKGDQPGEKFPAKIMFDKQCTQAFLCQSDFSEGMTIDHYGEILARAKVNELIGK